MNTRATKLASKLGQMLADEHTGLIQNAWYVAAISTELESGKLLPRQLLGERVVMYRKQDGTVVALKDQCPHRSFPLSKSRLEGDEIICGYHGFRYGGNGKCTLIPTQELVPEGLRVRSFPVVEHTPLVWIWMGDPALASPESLPSQSWMQSKPGWVQDAGYLFADASYVHLHENLLDLSHLTYLHEGHFGTPDYAAAPFEVDLTETTFVVRRSVQPTTLPPIYAKPLEMEGKAAARIVTSAFISPAMQISGVVLRSLELPVEHRVDHHIRTAQLLTPKDKNSLHYFYLVCRDFACDEPEMSKFIMQNVTNVFQEDVDALELQREVRESSSDGIVSEQSVASDRAGVAMRRFLKKIAESGEPAPVASYPE